MARLPSLFLLLSSLLALSTAFPLLTNPFAAISKCNPSFGTSAVSVHFNRVDTGLEDQDGSAVQDPKGDFTTELNEAAALANSAYQALLRPDITDDPAYLAILGVQTDKAAAVSELKGNFLRIAQLASSTQHTVEASILNAIVDDDSKESGTTYASLEPGEVITTYAGFWTNIQKNSEVEPRRKPASDIRGPDLDWHLSRASIILHELLHASYIGIPPLLTMATTPQEVSGGTAVLAFAISHPELAIRNPDSLMYFALAMRFGFFQVTSGSVTVSKSVDLLFQTFIHSYL